MSMTTSIKIAGWLLMTVTHGGQVATANFPTEALCEDGGSMALYGQTVAEKAHSDMVADAARLVDEALWDRDHPPVIRQPKNDYERAQANKALEQHVDLSLGEGCGTYCIAATATKDGMIMEQTLYGAGMMTFGTYDAAALAATVNIARCFPVPADQ
jgi:hypothetical protein